MFIGSPIDDGVANAVIAQLLFLDSQNPKEDIKMYINSPGGSVTSALAIYDTMQLIRPEVRTVCTGQASNIAALILAAGTKGKRSALPHSRILLHQPMGGASGQASDIEIQAREILYLRSKMNELMAKHSGRPVEQVERDTDRDRFMSADEAKEYGLIDQIVSHRGEVIEESKQPTLTA